MNTLGCLTLRSISEVPIAYVGVLIGKALSTEQIIIRKGTSVSLGRPVNKAPNNPSQLLDNTNRLILFARITTGEATPSGSHKYSHVLQKPDVWNR